VNKKTTVFSLCIIIFISFLFTHDIFSQITLSSRTDFALTSGATLSEFADFNIDGKPDIAVTRLNNYVSVFLNTTTPGASTPAYGTRTDLTGNSTTHGIASADFNGDGKPDIAVSDGASVISVFLNTTSPGSSTASFTAKTDFTIAGTGRGISAADFNGDGKQDLAVANNSANSISIILNTTSPGASTPSFTAKTDFATQLLPRNVAVADINGDGRPDMAAANFGNSSVSVFINTTVLGSSTPSFAPKTDVSVPGVPWYVSLGDMNNDGKNDMAVTELNGDKISILLNTTVLGSSTPEFGTITNFATGPNPYEATLKDFNNDGKLDMFVSNSSTSSFSAFLNITSPGASTPAFLTRQDFTAGPFLSSISVDDVNLDGKPDLLVPNGSPDFVSVYLNTTDLSNNGPSFGTKTDLTVNSYPAFVCTADFNGDGKPDIANTNWVSNNLSVLLNTVTPGAVSPSFSPKTDFTTGNAPYSIKDADFNNDGRPDIICTNRDSKTISIFINTTSPGATVPTFTPKSDFSSVFNPVMLTLNDFNGDGLMDIVCGDYIMGRVRVFLNTTAPGSLTPLFTGETNFATADQVYGVISRDFNNDGKPDLACGSTASGTVSILFNTTAPGSMTPSFAPKSYIPATLNEASIAAEDINGDGKIDFLTTHFSSGLISIFINNTFTGSLTQSFSRADFAYCEGRDVLLKDFNGDGRPDIAIVDYNLNVMSISINNTAPGSPTPSFSPRVDFPAVISTHGLSSADFNLDGKPDIVCTNANPAGPLSVFLNTLVYALPVELASFTSSVNGNNVMLNWNTVSEENNSGFEIERSSFGNGWKKVGFVNGKGTTNIAQNYSFTDNGLNSGRYLYRLKQIDYNGNYKYYDLQNEVVIGVPQKFALMQNYPNPFNPTTKINYEIPVNGFVALKIFDISGREVMQLVNQVQQAGYYAVVFNAAGLSSGTYFYKLSTDKFNAVKKMVVIK
jgi:hypothetical protein